MYFKEKKVEEITLKAYGKINLGLDVTGLREDGYHMVRMIMQTVELHDTVVISKRTDKNITMECDREELPVDGSNLCVKSAKSMIEKYNIEHGYHIKLTKRIPVAAGMAGGSTDAAAVFCGINELENIGASVEELMELSLPIGADVPYCVMQGTALAEGIGEELTALSDMVDCAVLIAKPEASVSTRDVYRALDSKENYPHPDIDGIVKAIGAKDLDKICALFGNVLQDVTIPMHPEIEELKLLMKENGAVNSMMSGSGPTVFGIFKDADAMHKCKELVEQSGLANQVYETAMYNVRRV